MKHWVKLSKAEQDTRITAALRENIDYNHTTSLGLPVSKLDGQVFSEQATFLKDAPLLRTIVYNPNHIGCHTLGESEPFFAGTQAIEKEVIEMLSVDMLGAEEQSCDGYVATGGTEANLQACWIYRNYFMKKHRASRSEITLLASEDTHYSVAKASDILQTDLLYVPVDNESRKVIPEELDRIVREAAASGKKYFIIIANMATTMFGSVDNPEDYTACMRKYNLSFRLHIDGAFGGFIYPLSTPGNNSLFTNPDVSSVTLDAHKMLQAPYGTGVFIVRKGLMPFVYTEQAKYVNGMDITLSGSRSGANAIAVWMILVTYGFYGWLEKINKLLYRTNRTCEALDKLNIRYYRQPKMNIIAIRAEDIPHNLAVEYGLVPDTHSGQANWYKIVVMDHVELDVLQEFVNKIEAWQRTGGSVATGSNGLV